MSGCRSLYPLPSNRRLQMKQSGNLVWEVVRDEQVRNSTQCHLDPGEKGLLFDSRKLSNKLVSCFTYRCIYIFYKLWSLRRWAGEHSFSSISMSCLHHTQISSTSFWGLTELFSLSIEKRRIQDMFASCFF